MGVRIGETYNKQENFEVVVIVVLVWGPVGAIDIHSELEFGGLQHFNVFSLASLLFFMGSYPCLALA